MNPQYFASQLIPSKSKQVKASRWTAALNAKTYNGDAMASMTLKRLQNRNKGGSTMARKAVPKKPFNTQLTKRLKARVTDYKQER